MSDAGDAVVAALESAATGDKANADSTPQEESSSEVTEQSTKVEEGTKEKKAPTSTEKKENRIPEKRFAEVVSAKNAALERIRALETEISQGTDEKTDLKDQVRDLKKEVDILNRVRNLATDEREVVRNAVETIDKALKNILETEETSKKTEADEDVLKQTKELISKHDQKLTERESAEKQKELYNSADDIAAEMLSHLPEEYTDEDKAILGELWTPRVNWEKIYTEGENSIFPTLKESFIKLIKDYGDPKGAVAKTSKEEIEAQIPKEHRLISVEDTVKGIFDKEWTKKDDKGKLVLSDDEFTANLAELARNVGKGA